MSPRAAVPQAAVAQYLASLPEDRRRELTRVREVISANLPAGYEEASDARMITYRVPLSVYPDTYNKQALWFAALASMKNYMTLHLLPV